MIQILLVLFGLVALVKGEFKITSKRKVSGSIGRGLGILMLVGAILPLLFGTNFSAAPIVILILAVIVGLIMSESHAQDDVQKYTTLLKSNETFIEGVRGLGKSKQPEAAEEILSMIKTLAYYELEQGIAIIDAAKNNGDNRMVAPLIAQYTRISNPTVRTSIETALMKYNIPIPLKRTQQYHLGRSGKSVTSVEKFKDGLSLVYDDDDELGLVAELFLIDLCDGFWKEEGGGEFNEDGKNIRVREIGKMLHGIDGLNFMRQVHRQVSNDLGNSAGSVLESVWRGVGNWR